MRRVYAVVMVAVLSMLASGCWSLTWQEFVAPDGRFQVLMPGLPEMTTSEVQSGFGPLPQTIFSVDRGPQAYFVGFTELDAAILAAHSADEIIEDAAGRAAAGVGGDVTRFELTGYRGFPAADLDLTVAEGDGVIQARFVLVDERLYRLSAIVATEISDDAVNRRFLDSFTVLQR